MKHTPGPWFVDSDELDSCYVAGPDAQGNMPVASLLVDCERAGQSMRANARLIAAAPEMLVEIRRYLSIAKREGWHATITELEKLITKATGKSDDSDTIAKASAENYYGDE